MAGFGADCINSQRWYATPRRVVCRAGLIASLILANFSVPATADIGALMSLCRTPSLLHQQRVDSMGAIGFSAVDWPDTATDSGKEPDPEIEMLLRAGEALYLTLFFTDRRQAGSNLEKRLLQNLNRGQFRSAREVFAPVDLPDQQRVDVFRNSNGILVSLVSNLWAGESRNGPNQPSVTDSCRIIFPFHVQIGTEFTDPIQAVGDHRNPYEETFVAKSGNVFFFAADIKSETAANNKRFFYAGGVHYHFFQFSDRDAIERYAEWPDLGTLININTFEKRHEMGRFE